MSQLTQVNQQELAATTIQRIRRGYIKRNELNKMEHAAKTIQRLGIKYLLKKQCWKDLYNEFKHDLISAPAWFTPSTKPDNNV